ncbi:MAG: HAD hydrolase family protein [Trueperaceae bacterium]
MSRRPTNSDTTRDSAPSDAAERRTGDPHDPTLAFALREPIRVFACDIDGCLAPVGHGSYDMTAMARIQSISRSSEHDPSVPALTLVTGRPQPYVDALLQMLHVRLPASFENGAGLCARHPYRSWFVLEVEEGRDVLQRAERLLADQDDLTLQLGKAASMSVFAVDSEALPVPALAERLNAWADQHDLPLTIDPSSDCVNLLLPGVDKVRGLTALCDATDVTPAQVAGIGDSVGDAAWLRRCGVSVAPSGARPEARDAVAYASILPDAHATLATYLELVRANRTLGVGPGGT